MLCILSVVKCIHAVFGGLGRRDGFGFVYKVILDHFVWFIPSVLPLLSDEMSREHLLQL